MLVTYNVIFNLTQTLLYDRGKAKTADGSEGARTLSPPSSLPFCQCYNREGDKVLKHIPPEGRPPSTSQPYIHTYG